MVEHIGVRPGLSPSVLSAQCVQRYDMIFQRFFRDFLEAFRGIQQRFSEIIRAP